MSQSLLQARENLEWMCRSAWNKARGPLYLTLRGTGHGAGSDIAMLAGSDAQFRVLPGQAGPGPVRDNTRRPPPVRCECQRRRPDQRRTRRRTRVLADLAVLTPPLVVGVAALIAIGAFLRHEMSGHSPGDDDALSADISVNEQIPDAGNSEAATPPDPRTGNDSPG
jgi:hypothetical protein